MNTSSVGKRNDRRDALSDGKQAGVIMHVRTVTLVLHLLKCQVKGLAISLQILAHPLNRFSKLTWFTLWFAGEWQSKTNAPLSKLWFAEPLCFTEVFYSAKIFTHIVC